jgi:hypothetical protein
MIEAAKAQPATVRAFALGQNIDSQSDEQSKKFLFRQTASGT